MSHGDRLSYTLLLPVKLPADLLHCITTIISMYCSMPHAASRSTHAARHAIQASLCCLLCAAAGGASVDVISANLYVTDSPVSSAYGSNATAGDRLVANFALRDMRTNATVGASLGYCVLLRDTGPNQCLYTIQFASGTIQVCHTALRDLISVAVNYLRRVFDKNAWTCKQLLYIQVEIC